MLERGCFAVALASDDLAYMRASHLVMDGGKTAYA
jgi:hypothetical protein